MFIYESACSDRYDRIQVQRHTDCADKKQSSSSVAAACESVLTYHQICQGRVLAGGCCHQQVQTAGRTNIEIFPFVEFVDFRFEVSRKLVYSLLVVCHLPLSVMASFHLQLAARMNGPANGSSWYWRTGHQRRPRQKSECTPRNSFSLFLFGSESFCRAPNTAQVRRFYYPDE